MSRESHTDLEFLSEVEIVWSLGSERYKIHSDPVWRDRNPGIPRGQWPQQAVQTGGGDAEVCRYLHQVCLRSQSPSEIINVVQAETLFPRDSWQCWTVQETGQHHPVLAREVQEQTQVYNAWRLVSSCKYITLYYITTITVIRARTNRYGQALLKLQLNWSERMSAALT